MKYLHSLWHLFSPVATHSIAGLMFSFGLVAYLMRHPEAFTPGVFTQCAVGLLASIAGVSAAHTFTQHKCAKAAAQTEAPVTDAPLAPTPTGEK